MSFLTPAFFLGALALAIPVIIHLTNREKREIVEFPSLMFLRRIPYRSVRRQRLRHLLLFALRCLALSLLVLAFARPFFDSPLEATAAPLGPREVVVVLDHSYSMGYEGRLDRAKDEARSRIAGLGPDERGSIVLFSDRAEIVVQSSVDPLELGAVVDGVELSSGTTRYGPAMKLAQKIVDESDLDRREVVLVSDFQRIGWQGDEDVWLPTGTELIPVDVGEDGSDNLSVTGVILEREPSSGRERLTASARVTYKTTTSEPRRTTIELELDSRSLQSKTVELAPNDATTVSFEPFTLPAGVARGTVRLGDDALEADNRFHFVLWPGQSISVLTLDGPGRRSLYLQRALGIGDRPSFRWTTKRASQLSASDLDGKQVVILNDARGLDASDAGLLERFVEGGGGLVVVLGAASSADGFGSAADLLPAAPGASVDRARDWGGTLTFLDYQSPVFDVFSAPHSGDFSAAKFFRYRGFQQPVTDGVLARYDDGAVALAERRVGEGRVLVWTSTLDTFWNDLARQPVYLPFVHQLVKHAAGYSEATSWHTVGEVASLTSYLELAGLEAAGAERDYELIVSPPTGERIIVPPSEEAALLTLDEQGFYELRRSGRGAGRDGELTLAANLDTTESDLARLDPEELVASVGLRDTAATASGDSGLSASEQEGQQGFWWYVLVAAFVLLAAETILSNRLSRARTVVGVEV